MRKILFCALLLLVGCQSLPPAPSMVETFNAPYQKLGECFFARAGTEEGEAGLTYADLKMQQRVLVRKSQQMTAIYEVAFIRTDDSITRVEMKTFPTIYGPDFYAKRMLPWVQSCAAT